MRTEDFNFYLPDSLIAQHPSAARSASRLLKLDGNTGNIGDSTFNQLVSLLSKGDLLVFNDTRVIKARLFGRKHSGGQIELMVERVLDDCHVMAQIRASRAPKAGALLRLADTFDAEVLGRNDDLFRVKFLGDATVLDLLDAYGALPLPPYITHAAEKADDERYQTVYAKHAGAVAAPTAGLHFDEDMLLALKNKGVSLAYVTLHVGAGTFQPVRADNIAEHKMHSERYQISAETIDAITATKAAGKKVIAVGTTSLRALESAAVSGRMVIGSAETSIFITPGFQFKIVDTLITNFHLPKSTLLMLVSAFAGFAHVKMAYQHAVQEQYRFFSYGDAMLINRQDGTNDINKST